MNVVREIMSGCAVTIRPDFTMADATLLLVGHHIDGAPVVGIGGELLGFISEPELLDIAFDPSIRKDRVTKHMTVDVQTVAPDDPIFRVAQLFALFPFRRMPVVEHGKLIGIVSRRDVLHYALRSNKPIKEPLSELVTELAHTS